MVAMGEARTRESAGQIAMVCLDELVSADDRYRRIDEIVGDWGFVREAARPYYSDGIGRPSIDPTVLLKLMLVGALEGIGSMRELLRVAELAPQAKNVVLQRSQGRGRPQSSLAGPPHGMRPPERPRPRIARCLHG